MKQDDFERLKAICEKEGFELGFKYDECTYTVRKKNDPWEGVEFVECVNDYICSYTVGKVYKLTRKYAGENMAMADNSIETYVLGNTSFKPSTEAAYVDQLKKEAFERFGDIKDGQLFDCSSLNMGTCPIIMKQGNKPFLYFKELDEFRKGGFTLYQQGKWAERVKERPEITFVRSYKALDDIYYFGFRHNTDGKFYDVGQFLASQLEKFLNGEID